MHGAFNPFRLQRRMFATTASAQERVRRLSTAGIIGGESHWQSGVLRNG
jgi:hypothetical protein